MERKTILDNLPQGAWQPGRFSESTNSDFSRLRSNECFGTVSLLVLMGIQMFISRISERFDPAGNGGVGGV